MRTLELPRIAARAEGFRLRALLRRQAIRALLGFIAAMFLLVALAAANVAGAMALAERMPPIEAVLIMAGIDVLVAIVLAALAARDVPSDVEREALAVRRAAVNQAIETVVVASLIRRLFRARSMREVSDVASTVVASWMVGKRS
jgi:arginine exporter protein ArgO